MEQFEEQLTTQKGKTEKMKWKYEDNDGNKWEDQYEGEVSNGKRNGYGKFNFGGGFGLLPFRIEGYWVQGKLKGKAVQYYSHGDRRQFEMDDGKYHGSYLRFYNDGRLEMKEFKRGKEDGRVRIYGKDKSIVEEGVYEEGKLFKRIR